MGINLKENVFTSSHFLCLESIPPCSYWKHSWLNEIWLIIDHPNSKWKDLKTCDAPCCTTIWVSVGYHIRPRAWSSSPSSDKDQQRLQAHSHHYFYSQSPNIKGNSSTISPLIRVKYTLRTYSCCIWFLVIFLLSPFFAMGEVKVQR